MNSGIKNFNAENPSMANKALWAVFLLYIVLSGYTIAHHEMWGDEIHSWNIAKGSGGFSDLMNNIRYEGHPPAWYIIIWTISKFTHDLQYVQAAHWSIACLSVFLILFFSPLAVTSRILLPFGYYFLFEYSVLSRNYAIGVLLTIIICVLIRKDFRYKMFVYYGLLFLLSNTHLLGILIAGSLHMYFLVFYNEQKIKKSILVIHALIGMITVLPAVYFIFPPSDSEMNVQFWLSRWGTRNFIKFSQAPLRAFVPVSSVRNYNFWNTNMILETTGRHEMGWIADLIISIGIVTTVFFILKGNKKSNILFFSNLLFSFIVAMLFFTLGSARYAGFLYISFIASYWLYCYEVPVAKRNKILVNLLLVIQLSGSVIPVVRDISSPFSNACRVNDLLSKVPLKEKAVTDYWALNAIAAFADRPFYCVDLQKEISFLTWDGKLKSRLSSPSRYTDGIANFFYSEGINKVYLLSTVSLPVLSIVDKQLQKAFQVQLIDKIEGAIERDSNLYLYEIKSQ